MGPAHRTQHSEAGGVSGEGEEGLATPSRLPLVHISDRKTVESFGLDRRYRGAKTSHIDAWLSGLYTSGLLLTGSVPGIPDQFGRELDLGSVCPAED